MYFLIKKSSISSLKINEEATKKLRQERINKSPQVLPSNNKDEKEIEITVNNVPGKIYGEPKFLPGGDKYMLIEFGNVMDLELNFTAQNLAQAITK